MPESLQPSTDHYSENEPIIKAWDTEHVRDSYKGRIARVPYWKVVESNTHEPYVKDSLHRVADAVIFEDDSVKFTMVKLEEIEATYDSTSRTRIISRPGRPDEIIIQGEREIWIYGDRGAEDDQTLSFSLARN